MKFRAFVIVLAVVIAGCAEPAPEVRGDGELFRYGYQPGDHLVYETLQQMEMAVEADGADGILGALDTQMVMDLGARLEYSFAEGPQPDMVAITVGTTFLSGSATMTSMGQTQSIPMDELTGLGTIETTVVVDANGHPTEVTVGGQTLALDLLGDFQGLGGLGGLGTPQHLGPEFPDHPVAVGDSWETETSQDLMGIEFRQRGEHRIVGQETVAGRPTYKVASVIRTDGMELDFADLTGLSMAAAGSLDPASVDEMQMALDMFESMGIDMRYQIADTVLEMTSWFDPVAGIVVRLELAAPMTMTVEIRDMPDLPSGDLRMVADMDIRQSMRLAG
jgi:hypothetical protein